MVIRYWRSALLVSAAFIAWPVAQAYSQSAPATTTAAAAADDGGTTLQKIVVKGKRVMNAGDVANTPLATETSEATLEAKQVRSIEDFGRAIDPGVNFNRSTNSVNIRGLEGNRVATLVDGIPLTYFRDGARGTSGGTDSFDFFSLTTVDVVKGADSSRIGGGAMGGALLLRTLEPADLIGEGKDWGGKVGTGYDSTDNSWFNGAAVAKRVENTSIMFLGSYKKGHERENQGTVDTYGATRTKANPADYDQYNMLFKLRQETDSGHTFGFTAERFRFDKDTDLMQGQTPTGNYRPGNYSSGELNERTRVSLDYEYEAPSTDGLIDAAQATFYWQKQERMLSTDAYRYTSVPGVYLRQNSMDESGFGFNGYIDSGFKTGMVDHVLTLGATAFISQAGQYSAGVDSCPASAPYTGLYAACSNLHTNQSDMPDVDSKDLSIFVQDRMTLGDSGFSLTPGLRFDWYDRNPQDTPAYTDSPLGPSMPRGSQDSALSPKLLAEYELSDNVTLFAQWAMAFRAPTTNELYLTYGGVGTYLTVGNPDLEPETSNGFDVGARFGDEDLGGSVSLFYNRYRNFIDTRALTTAEAMAIGYDPADYGNNVSGYQNVARAQISGVEIGAHQQFANGFNVRAGLAYTRGMNLITNKELNSVAPLKGTIGLGYAAEQWGVDALFTAVAGVSDKSTATFKAPGYGIVDLTAWWEPEQMKGLRINAGVYNVFDRTYFDALNLKTTTVSAATRDYYSEPGRTFKISLTQRF
jgi:hemoglobin/transferrin/lactoferrin receptor protein